MPGQYHLLAATTLFLLSFTGADTEKKPQPPPTVRDIPMNYPFCGPIGAVALNPFNHQHMVVASEMGGLFETNNTGSSWRHLGNFNHHLVNDVLFTQAPGGFELWAVTSECFKQVPGAFIWKRAVNGSWSQATLGTQPLFGQGNAYRIIQQASSGDIYACGDFGIMVKRSWSNSFSRIAVTGNPSVFAVEVLQNGTILAGTAFGVMVGTPGRTSYIWAISSNTPKFLSAGDRFSLVTDVTRNIAFAAGPNTAGTNFQLWTSTDGGTRWQAFNTQPAPVVNNAGGLVTINPRYDFAAKKLTIYFSNRYEVNYAVGNGNTIGEAVNSMQASRTLEWKGKINSSTIAHDDTRHVLFLTLSQVTPKMMITSDGGIHTAEIRGTEPERYTWSTTSTASGLKNAEVTTITGDGTNIYFATWHTGFGASVDRFSTWSSGASAALKIFGGEGYVVSMRGQDNISAANIMVGPQLKFSKKIFGLDRRDEVLWTNPNGAPTSTWGPTFVNTTVWIQDGVPAAGSTNTPWFITTNNSGSWATLPATSSTRIGCGYLARQNPTSPLFVYTVGLSTRAGIQLGQLSSFTTPASASWRLAAQNNLVGGIALTGSFNYFTPVFAVHPFNASEILAIEQSTGKLKKSTDRGDNWSELTSFNTAYGVPSGKNLRSNNGIPAVWCISYNPSNPNQILAGTVTEGMFYSSDGGNSWTGLNNPGLLAPTGIYWHNNRTAYVCTYGRGIFEINL